MDTAALQLSQPQKASGQPSNAAHLHTMSQSQPPHSRSGGIEASQLPGGVLAQPAGTSQLPRSIPDIFVPLQPSSAAATAPVLPIPTPLNLPVTALAAPDSAPRSPAPSSRSSGGAKKRQRGRQPQQSRSRRRRSGSEEWTPSREGADARENEAVSGLKATTGVTENRSSGPEESVDGANAPSAAAGGAGGNFQRGCGNPVVQVSRELKQSFDAHIAEQLRQCTVSVTEGGPEHAPVLGRVLQLACHALRDLLDKKVVTAAHVRTQFGDFQAEHRARQSSPTKKQAQRRIGVRMPTDVLPLIIDTLGIVSAARLWGANRMLIEFMFLCCMGRVPGIPMLVTPDVVVSATTGGPFLTAQSGQTAAESSMSNARGQGVKPDGAVDGRNRTGAKAGMANAAAEAVAHATENGGRGDGGPPNRIFRNSPRGSNGGAGAGTFRSPAPPSPLASGDRGGAHGQRAFQPNAVSTTGHSFQGAGSQFPGPGGSTFRTLSDPPPGSNHAGYVALGSTSTLSGGPLGSYGIGARSSGGGVRGSAAAAAAAAAAAGAGLRSHPSLSAGGCGGGAADAAEHAAGAVGAAADGGAGGGAAHVFSPRAASAGDLCNYATDRQCAGGALRSTTSAGASIHSRIAAAAASAPAGTASPAVSGGVAGPVGPGHAATDTIAPMPMLSCPESGSAAPTLEDIYGGGVLPQAPAMSDPGQGMSGMRSTLRTHASCASTLLMSRTGDGSTPVTGTGSVPMPLENLASSGASAQFGGRPPLPSRPSGGISASYAPSNPLAPAASTTANAQALIAAQAGLSGMCGGQLVLPESQGAAFPVNNGSRQGKLRRMASLYKEVTADGHGQAGPLSAEAIAAAAALAAAAGGSGPHSVEMASDGAGDPQRTLNAPGTVSIMPSGSDMQASPRSMHTGHTGHGSYMATADQAASMQAGSMGTPPANDDGVGMEAPPGGLVKDDTLKALMREAQHLGQSLPSEPATSGQGQFGLQPAALLAAAQAAQAAVSEQQPQVAAASQQQQQPHAQPAAGREGGDAQQDPSLFMSKTPTLSIPVADAPNGSWDPLLTFPVLSDVPKEEGSGEHPAPGAAAAPSAPAQAAPSCAPTLRIEVLNTGLGGTTALKTEASTGSGGTPTFVGAGRKKQTNASPAKGQADAAKGSGLQGGGDGCLADVFASLNAQSHAFSSDDTATMVGDGGGFTLRNDKQTRTAEGSDTRGGADNAGDGEAEWPTLGQDISFAVPDVVERSGDFGNKSLKGLVSSGLWKMDTADMKVLEFDMKELEAVQAEGGSVGGSKGTGGSKSSPEPALPSLAVAAD